MPGLGDIAFVVGHELLDDFSVRRFPTNDHLVGVIGIGGPKQRRDPQGRDDVFLGGDVVVIESRPFTEGIADLEFKYDNHVCLLRYKKEQYCSNTTIKLRIIADFNQ